VVGVAPGAEHHRTEAELADRYTGASEWSKFHKSSSQLSVAGAALSLDEASTFRGLRAGEIRRTPLLGSRVNRVSEDVRSPSALHRGHIRSVAEPHCTETSCGLTKRRRADLRLIKHRPWFALYPPEEFVSGIKGPLMSKWEPFSFRVFRLGKPIQESRRADSNRLPLLITSVRSGVAERCRGLQIPHKQRVFCSLHCSPLQGIAFGLGSN
jgi:hypothetical protein